MTLVFSVLLPWEVARGVGQPRGTLQPSRAAGCWETRSVAQGKAEGRAVWHELTLA